MAESLSSLNQVFQDQQAAAPQPDVPNEKLAGQPLNVNVFARGAGAPRQVMGGDELMNRAIETRSISPADKLESQLFQDSVSLFQQKVDSDPSYYNKVRPELLQKKGYELGKFIVDEVDKDKINLLKTNYPNLFNGPEAALNAFGNSALFQQLSRAQALGGAIFGKQPTLTGEQPKDFGDRYSSLLFEAAEWGRLLQKEYPGSDFSGKMASYFVPGSPVKAVFTRLSNLGAKGGEALLNRIISNPKLLDSMVSKSVQGAAGAGLAAGAIGTVEGMAGSGEQGFSFDRGLEQGAVQGVGGAIGGAVLPPIAKYFPLETAGATVGGIAGGAAGFPLVGMAAGAAGGAALRGTIAANRNVPAALSKISGASAGALRTYNKMGQSLSEYAGTKPDIQREFFNFLNSDPIRQLPEKVNADKLLPFLPPVNAKPLLDFLEQKIANPTKEQKVVLAELADRAQWVRNQIKLIKARPNAVPAEEMRNIIETLQDTVKSYYQMKDVPQWAGHLKEAAHIGRQSIVDTAEKIGGQTGQDYVDLMKKAYEKRQILAPVVQKLGKDTKFWPDKIQLMMDGMFGKNANIRLQRMQQIDDTWGTSFVKNYRLATYAEQLGPEGVPQALSQVPTGAVAQGGLTGGAIGSAVGGTIGGVVGGIVGHPYTGAKIGTGIGATLGTITGTALTSPKMSALGIGASDKMTNVLAKIAGEPEVIKAMSENKNIPIEFRKMAKMISDTLTKDGPMSAGSMLRIAADTPFFLGLVNYLDLTERRMKGSAQESAVNKTLQNQQPLPRSPQSEVPQELPWRKNDFIYGPRR